ncbi:hypothetical protein D3C74_248870 [compost metagenome]
MSLTGLNGKHHIGKTEVGRVARFLQPQAQALSHLRQRNPARAARVRNRFRSNWRSIGRRDGIRAEPVRLAA